MIRAGNSFSIPGIAKKSLGEHRLAFGRKTCFNSKLICHLIFQFSLGLWTQTWTSSIFGVLVS